LVKDRPEEALASLKSYRTGKFTDAQIEAEFEEQRAMISVITNDRGTFKELFQGTNRRRTLIVIGSNLCVQISGQGLFSKYGTIFLADLNGPNPFQMFFINSGIQLVVFCCALFLFDRTGRK
jgi:MFS transporter, SP family, sugar:H+ symporter